MTRGARFTDDELGVLVVEVCPECNTPFAMSVEVHRVALARGKNFSLYCPNGHPQHYPKGESQEDKLRRERDRLMQKQAWYEQRLHDEREARERAERKMSAARSAGRQGRAGVVVHSRLPVSQPHVVTCLEHVNQRAIPRLAGRRRMSDATSHIIDAAQKLVDAVSFDNNGEMGRGGNGGLISRETMRAADELRLELYRFRRTQSGTEAVRP